MATSWVEGLVLVSPMGEMLVGGVPASCVRGEKERQTLLEEFMQGTAMHHQRAAAAALVLCRSTYVIQRIALK